MTSLGWVCFIKGLLDKVLLMKIGLDGDGTKDPKYCLQR